MYILIDIVVRTKDLHLYLLDMSQLCYYYINPHLIKWKKLKKVFLALKGFEPLKVMMKTLCRNHLTIRPIYIYRSPVQVSHLFQLVTKQSHYFYANQAKHTTNLLFHHYKLCRYHKYLVIYKISTLYLKILKFLQLKPINCI